MTAVRTTCAYCGVDCGVAATATGGHGPDSSCRPAIARLIGESQAGMSEAAE